MRLGAGVVALAHGLGQTLVVLLRALVLLAFPAPAAGLLVGLVGEGDHRAAFVPWGTVIRTCVVGAVWGECISSWRWVPHQQQVTRHWPFSRPLWRWYWLPSFSW